MRSNRSCSLTHCSTSTTTRWPANAAAAGSLVVGTRQAQVERVECVHRDRVRVHRKRDGQTIVAESSHRHLHWAHCTRLFLCAISGHLQVEMGLADEPLVRTSRGIHIAFGPARAL